MEGLGGKWEVPAPRFATLYQAKSLPVWDPKPPVADQKGRSLLSYLLSEQNSAGGRSSHAPAQRNLAEPPLRGHKPCWELGQRKFLEAFTAPVPPPPLLPPLSSAVTASLLRPLRHQPPQNTALVVPAPAASPLSSWPSTGSGTPPTTSCVAFDHILQPLCA